MKKRSITYSLSILLFVCMLFICPAAVHAEEESTEDYLKASITLAEGLSETVIGLKVELSEGWAYMDLYRAKGSGSFSLLDRIERSGSQRTDSSGNWYMTGNQSKVYWYPNDYHTTYLYDMSAKLGSVYQYKIIMSNRSDASGPESNIAKASAVLSAPQLVDGIRLSASSIKLSWTTNTNAGGYELQRKAGSKWKKIKTFSKKTKSYTDTNLKVGTFKYRIRAYKKVSGKKVYSDWSNVLTAKTKSPTVKGTYSPGSVYGPSLSQAKLNEVRAVIQCFKDNYIKSSMTDLQKVWAAFSFLRAKSSYAWRGWQYNNANTAWGALVYGEAQCSGYARAMKALCDAIGIKCYYIHANAKASNPSHQWNLVRVGGKWYILDAQGGFFLVGTSTWSSTGLTWNTSGLPKCSKNNHPQGGFVSSEI